MFRFTICELLSLTVVVALVTGCNTARNKTRRIASVVFHNASSTTISYCRVRSPEGDLDIESGNIIVGAEKSFSFAVPATRPQVGGSIDVLWTADERERTTTIDIEDRIGRNDALHVTFGDDGSVTVSDPKSGK